MKKRIWIWILLSPLALALLCALLCLISAFFSARTFIVTQYKLSAPLERPLRLVQLSDLHNREYGEENRRLIDRVRALEPDLILMTGDMINSDDPDLSILLDLTHKMSEIAPVYCCYGNHETSWMKHFGVDMRPGLEQAGATVLEAEFLDLECLGNALRLGGYSGYYHTPHMLTQDPARQAAEIRFTEDFENTDVYKILLNHIPTNWLDWEYRNLYDVDLVFCGHYHGGVIRFPWGGGLYAPYIGFFPPYTKGIFTGDRATVILSAGLGSSGKLPRINNPGEIVCVDLLPEK